jgi:hypothetical protein
MMVANDDHLQLVSQVFSDLTQLDMPLDYLRRGTVSSWYIDGQLAAAFAFITEPPFMVSSMLREDQLDDHLRECLAQGLVGEFNGLFVHPEARARVNGWAVMKTALRFFVKSDTKCALFGYDKERPGLSALYQRPLLSPVKLLEGALVLPEAYMHNMFLGYLRADHIAKALRF